MEEFKPTWYQRDATLAAAALVTALAVHLVFTLMIRPASGSGREETIHRSGIYFLSPEEHSAEEWRRLCRWIRENDPAIIASSDSPYGYSVMRKPVEVNRKWPRRDPLHFAPPEKKATVIQPLNVEKDPLRTVEMLRWNEKMPEKEADSLRRLSFFDQNAKPVRLPQFEQALKKHLSSRSKPFTRAERHTMIRWRTNRPELLSSCGNAELDRFALTVLSSPRNYPAGCTFLEICWPDFPAARAAVDGKEKP